MLFLPRRPPWRPQSSGFGREVRIRSFRWVQPGPADAEPTAIHALDLVTPHGSDVHGRQRWRRAGSSASPVLPMQAIGPGLPDTCSASKAMRMRASTTRAVHANLPPPGLHHPFRAAGQPDTASPTMCFPGDQGGADRGANPRATNRAARQSVGSGATMAPACTPANRVMPFRQGHRLNGKAVYAIHPRSGTTSTVARTDLQAQVPLGT